MDIDIIHKLLNSGTIDDAHDILRKKGKDLLSIINRKIYYSAIIYKFSEEIECPDELKSIARNILLKILQNMEYKTLISQYIVLFDQWKNRDMLKLIENLSFNYYNLNEILNGIIKSPNDVDTDNIWIKEITSLQNKILSYINKLKGNEIHQKNMIIFEKEKEKQITKIVDNAFWKLFQENLENNDYEMLIINYKKMKEKLLEIKNDKDIEEYFDVDLLTNDILSNNFKAETLISMIKFICNKLLQYGPPSLDKKIIDLQVILIKMIDEKGLTPTVITLVFKNIFQNIIYINSIISAYRYMY